MADVGTGASIAFATSSYAAEVTAISLSGQSRDPYETTNLATTGGKTFAPGNLVMDGDIEIEFALDPDKTPPIDQAAESITITFPLPAGGISAATLIGTGFMTNYSIQMGLEEKMTGSATIRWDGATRPAYTAST